MTDSEVIRVLDLQSPGSDLEAYAEFGEEVQGARLENRRGRPNFLRQPRPRCSGSGTAGSSLMLALRGLCTCSMLSRIPPGDAGGVGSGIVSVKRKTYQ